LRREGRANHRASEKPDAHIKQEVEVMKKCQNFVKEEEGTLCQPQPTTGKKNGRQKKVMGIDTNPC